MNDPAPTVRRTIVARTGVELLDKIYEAEGWTRIEGEIRSRRASALYKLGRHNRLRLYVAKPYPEAAQ